MSSSSKKCFGVISNRKCCTLQSPTNFLLTKGQGCEKRSRERDLLPLRRLVAWLEPIESITPPCGQTRPGPGTQHCATSFVGRRSEWPCRPACCLPPRPLGGARRPLVAPPGMARVVSHGPWPLVTASRQYLVVGTRAVAVVRASRQ